MKFIFAFSLSILFVSCSLMQPNTARTSSQLSEKEITRITQLIGKEKIAKEVYENFHNQYQNNLFGNIAKRKQKHIEIWKNILAKQNINVLENETIEETENLKKQLLSDATDEISALKTAIGIEELNLNDIYIVRKNSQKSSIREAANGIECGTRNHLFVFYRALKEKNENYNHQIISGKKFKNIISGAVNPCGLQYD
ncbi:DUF2202 domain-containing protein [Cloacibacterium sp. TD35]|uniref:DUF2202 domain-containing protein n=1 Tax=Cloacibacterium sp. TD35 TaxID=2976818 RepID=UPI00237D8EB8|nr:DUF2202 domain-containing protein [Cloacibacterium sp. TD35]WDT67852.1 DUF2202 domain-containing protein [Cloacibacterium sp. TD35]